MMGSRPKRPATLRDVAAAAGVSTMTVSNLINGRLGAMSARTRERIEREIVRLGYRPHIAARSLRLAERFTIGMIIGHHSPTYLTDPFTTHLVAGLGNYLSERGYALLVQGLQSPEFERSLLIRNIQTDGMCAFLSGSNASRRASIELLLELRQPLVLFQETMRFPKRDLCSIRLDDRDGGRVLADEVLRAGAKRLVALIPRLYWPGMAERVAGMRDAIRKSGRKVTLSVVKSREMGFEEVRAALAQEIETNGAPDAVLAGNDQLGIAAMKFLAARGLTVPGDVLITGFNAFEFWQYTDPVLTTARSPAYEMGARAAHEILDRLRSGRFATSDIVYPVELQRGGST